MNLYGDHGNVLTLKRRCEWRGVSANIVTYEPGDSFPDEADLIFGGGGQDSGQSAIEDDLQKNAQVLRSLADGGAPALVICGLYQMFGRFFSTCEGKTIAGIGILDIETVAGDKRMIGNIVCESDEFGEIIGYENHSGQTYLSKGVRPLAKVICGAGNNGQDGSEGARYKNVIGSYLHGPMLPKNPKVADFLIAKALEVKYGDGHLEPLDDAIENTARQSSSERPR
jgi:CobQ-like glutamine amidotransferase family enzyme